MSDGFICGAWTIREQGPILNYEQPYVREQYVYRCDLPAGHEGDHVDSVLLTNWSGPTPEEVAKAKVAKAEAEVDVDTAYKCRSCNMELTKEEHKNWIGCDVCEGDGLIALNHAMEAEVDVETRWIDVNDRLPEIDSRILAYCPKLGMRETFFALYPEGSIARKENPDKGIFTWDEPKSNWIQSWTSVTHYRDRPAPPVANNEVEYQGKDK